MGNTGQCHQTDEYGGWLCDGCGCDVQGRSNCGPEIAFRFGWWGVQASGSPVKTGEYQDLKSSPFWDIDGIWTNGRQTLDFSLTGLDNEANNARGYYFGGPGFSAKVKYQRFFRRLDHDPLNTYDLANGPPAAGEKIVGEDLNVGQDYAIRVQQFDTRFQGRLTPNLKWKMNVWGMKKFGERQANATAHCFDLDPAAGSQNNTCHVLSQGQRIDWTTIEIQPVLEAQVGNAVVEYSRTMRGFGQDDQVVDRTYTRFGYSSASGTGGPDYDYAFVPDNFTQVDRLKVSAPLNAVNQFYANLYLGDTENKFRDTHRGFSGYDLRLTNRAIDGVTLTGYAKVDAQNNELPTTFLTTAPLGAGSGTASQYEPGSLRHPLEYNTTRLGVKGKWRPEGSSWLYITSGYEYMELARDYAEYDAGPSGLFVQQDTKSHQVNIGPAMRVSPTLNTFVRYKGLFTEDPLIGVRENDGKFNTNQPEQVHRVEVGGTWTPTPVFMATALFGVENSWNHSAYANFDEDNYPITCTLWYAATDRLSLTGGYAYFSNWIDQDITIGFRTNPTETTQWGYGGKNNLFSIGANYAWTPSTQLVGGIQWDRGSNVFSVPPSTAGADWSLLPFLSDVVVETTRINVGIDHQFAPAVAGYFRYNYFDYKDLSGNLTSGTTNMFLAGFTMLR